MSHALLVIRNRDEIHFQVFRLLKYLNLRLDSSNQAWVLHQKQNPGECAPEKSGITHADAGMCLPIKYYAT